MTRRFVYPLQAVLVRATYRADMAASEVGMAQRALAETRDRYEALQAQAKEAWFALAPRPGCSIDPARAGVSARHMQRWMVAMEAAGEDVEHQEAALKEVCLKHAQALASQRGFEAHRDTAGESYARDCMRRELLAVDGDWMLRRLRSKDDGDAHL